MPRHDHDAPPRAAGGGLDDELRPIARKVQELLHVAEAFDQGVGLGHSNAHGLANLLGEMFPIDPREEASRVRRQDEIPIATIDAHDARALSSLGHAQNRQEAWNMGHSLSSLLMGCSVSKVTVFMMGRMPKTAVACVACLHAAAEKTRSSRKSEPAAGRHVAHVAKARG